MRRRSFLAGLGGLATYPAWGAELLKPGHLLTPRGALGAANPLTIFGSDLVAWYDARDESTVFPLSTTRANRWADKSVNGLDLQQTTDANRPEYDGVTINGFQAMDFQSGDSLRLDSVSPTVSINFVLVVLENDLVWNASTTGGTIIGLNSNRTSGTFEFGSGTGTLTNEIIFYRSGAIAGWAHASDSLSAAPHIVSFYNPASAFEIRTDGGSNLQNVGTTGGTVTCNRIRVGQSGDGASSFMDGKIGEIILASSQDNAARLAALNYAASRWGITIT